MNRGIEGRPILQLKSDKVLFLELLEKFQKLMKIRILAYCLMDNHYHLVLQNESGRMSDFFKQLNGQYAINYRKLHGGRGYLFQDRYKTMLIQDDAYLMLAIAYVLNNPVRKKLVSSFAEYPWSSASQYFHGKPATMVDCDYVEDLFGTEDELVRLINNLKTDELPMVRSNLGLIVGGKDFIPKALKLVERRAGAESVERRRRKDMHFEPQEKVLAEFERIKKVKLTEIDVKTYHGKRLRSELLVLLREMSGMTYREIAKIDLFSDLELNSLGGLYRQARRHLSAE